MKSSIRQKLIILFLIFTIIPFGSSILVTFLYTKESLKDQTIEENAHLLYQGKVNIDSYVKELNNLSLSVYNHLDFISYLKSAEVVREQYISVSVVNQVLQTILYADQSIEALSLYIERNQQFITTSKQSSVIYSQQLNQSNVQFYQKAYEDPYNLYIKPSEQQTNASFTLHRSLQNVPADNTLGYISLQVNGRKLEELSRHLYSSGNEELIIITPDGNSVFQSSAIIEERDEQQWIEAVSRSGQESGVIEWQETKEPFVLIYDTIADSRGGWKLIKIIPESSLFESAYDVAYINILFGILGLSLVILATFFISYKITNPLTILVKNINEVKKGNMQVHFRTLGNDEIGELGDQFKEMVQKMDQLINREYKLEIENKTNQLKALQAQINPHFLYNALQSIGTQALKSDAPKVYSLITDLSKIMRYGIHTAESFVPLSQELSYVRSYLYLQLQRFEEKLEYSIICEEELKEIPVPKMLLQPLVENFFNHGFEQGEQAGKVTITCVQKERHIQIEVKDNGIGISAERLAQIQKQLKNPEPMESSSGNGVGLQNVYRRLKLYYNDQAHLELLKDLSGGFLVRLTIPNRTESDEI
ncbi:sensor histidine kinase [Alkalihalobacillus pseudalcaliphilus]|uniref:sensor histidine kinase n=1 Tax=Alkalihalobacillus pseudalcaliphilus TaxID=79884 RepID=UPI00064DDFB3|nr:sensor histidine kinase [Alkalihalobacillus pseudalcaliphilus]KMK77481.1 histidine kinase [Alkalihalobacillus pseudalcaliphilus]